MRRWKDKLSKLKEMENLESDEGEEHDPPTRLTRKKKFKIDTYEEEIFDDDEDFQNDSEIVASARKKRRLYVDREKVQYAKELIENKLSNKEMSMLLEMSIGELRFNFQMVNLLKLLSIACVRKLKMKILNGTVEELIDNSAEHYTKVVKAKEKATSKVAEVDPDSKLKIKIWN